MADVLEVKKLKAELARVTAAKLDMDVRVDERLAEIEKIKEQMAIQEAKETELLGKIAASTK